MTKKKVEEQIVIENEKVEVIKEEGKTIIVKAKEGLSLGQFELLSKMIKSEEKSTGFDIVLVPYSIDSVEVK